MPRPRHWVWIEEREALAIHDLQLAEHGGAGGLRDGGLLSSALARPKHQAAYRAVDIADLAAAYAFALLRNHPFVDGNKRAALVVAELFIDLNGHELIADDAALVLLFESAAAGKFQEMALADWFRARVRRIER